MKLSYFKSKEGNFGDDLNPYIFQSLLGEAVFNNDEYSDKSLYGIGTIIDQRLLKDPRKHKIIFGSGIRDPYFNLSSLNLDIRFVRGPLSANCISSNPLYISDAAYLLPLVYDTSIRKKKYKVSIVPYFRHMPNLFWKTICKMTGVHLIDPRNDLDVVIEDIKSSEKVICGAMHGAIVADICRVPWLRLKLGKHGFESHFVSEFKWKDWMGSIEIYDAPVLEINANNSLSRSVKFYLKKIPHSVEVFLNLLKVSTKDSYFRLSEEKTFNNIISRLSEQVDILQKEFSS